MLKTPKLSVLILTYNRLEVSSQYIPKLVDAVGDIPFEVLICDNGSTDGSCDWVYSYGKADCRVQKVICLEMNYGVEAFNFLAKEARGKYILKVDDDVDVPPRFGERLVSAYEQVNEPKLAFLGWDMLWNGSTFATRSGLQLYKEPRGKIVNIGQGERVLISFTPSKWMINGVCRLSTKETFFAIGGHPPGLKYGIDHKLSCVTQQHGYWIGYLTSKLDRELVVHHGRDTPKQRAWKDRELNKSAGLKSV